MINLDDIQSRLDRGQTTEADVQNLVTEAASQSVSIPQAALDRLGRGYRNPSDLSAVFALLESKYSTAFGRQTRAQKTSADIAAQQTAIAAAQATRQATSAAQAASEIAQQQAWQTTAAQAQSAHEATVQAQAALDRFNANQAATAAIIAANHDKAQRLQDVLNG